MRRIDYDTEQYQDYASGRALTEQQLQAWISAFGAVLPERRPLAGLDVGSGTGRWDAVYVRTNAMVCPAATVKSPASIWAVGTQAMLSAGCALTTVA